MWRGIALRRAVMAGMGAHRLAAILATFEHEAN